MYGYEYDYEFEPATESVIGDLIAKGIEQIKRFGNWVKETVNSFARKIREKLGIKKAESSSEFISMLEDAFQKSEALINDSTKLVDKYKTKFKNSYGKVTQMSDKQIKKADEGKFKHEVIHAKFAGNDGHLSKAYVKDYAHKAADVDKGTWDTFINEYAKDFKEAASDVDDLKATFNAIKAYKGAIDDIEAAKVAYKRLKEIYATNNEFGQKWADLKEFRDVSETRIKSIISKIYSVYSVGQSAVQSLASKIGRTSTPQEDNQNAMKYRERESQQKTKGNESVDVLTKLYQVAYEDAYATIMEEQHACEFFDSIPEYEF